MLHESEKMIEIADIRHEGQGWHMQWSFNSLHECVSI